MAFDWKTFRDELEGEPDWDDAEELGRLSMESFIAEQSPLRRDASSGVLRLTGAGISGNAGPIDGVSEALRNFQRLVLATAMSLAGHKSLQGPPPVEFVNKTRINLNGSPIPGSLVFRLVPAMAPSEEIAPTGQTGLFGDPDTQVIDQVVAQTLSLLEEGKRFGVNPDQSDFLERINDVGPRVASSLRDFAGGLASYEFEPTITWLQPRHPKIKTSLIASELVGIRDAIESNELEREPTVVRGILRTVSEIGPWQIETADKQVVRIDARNIPIAETSTLRTGMVLSVQATVVEKSGPASSLRTEYTATAFDVLDPDVSVPKE